MLFVFKVGVVIGQDSGADVKLVVCVAAGKSFGWGSTFNLSIFWLGPPPPLQLPPSLHCHIHSLRHCCHTWRGPFPFTLASPTINQACRPSCSPSSCPVLSCISFNLFSIFWCIINGVKGALLVQLSHVEQAQPGRLLCVYIRSETWILAIVCRWVKCGAAENFVKLDILGFQRIFCY